MTAPGSTTSTPDAGAAHELVTAAALQASDFILLVLLVAVPVLVLPKYARKLLTFRAAGSSNSSKQHGS